MESIGDARRFMSAARGFARNKPIIVLKPGRYAESARAALSHTGSMAGGDEIYEAAFRREGVVRVHEVADLFHAAEVLDSHRLPKGRDVAIVTNAGGLGVMATDSLVEHGGRLAELSRRRRWRSSTRRCPPYWSHANPIDVLGDAGSDRFAAAVKACLAESAVNGILLIYTPQGNARPDEMAKRSSELVKDSDKPVITVLMGGETVRNGRRIFQRGGHSRATRRRRTPSRRTWACTATPATSSCSTRPRRAVHRRRPAAPQPRGDDAPHGQDRAARAHRGGVQAVPHHVRHAGHRSAHRDARVGRGAQGGREIGYPVVLKVVSHEITHKNAAGGVEIGLCSRRGPRARRTRRCTTASHERAPGAVIEGVSVQKMVARHRLRAHPRA